MTLQQKDSSAGVEKKVTETEKINRKTKGSVKTKAEYKHMLCLQKIWFGAYECRYVGSKL
jgi:hypothetical protein